MEIIKNILFSEWFIKGYHENKRKNRKNNFKILLILKEMFIFHDLDPDPLQNKMDPENWFTGIKYHI